MPSLYTCSYSALDYHWFMATSATCSCRQGNFSNSASSDHNGSKDSMDPFHAGQNHSCGDKRVGCWRWICPLWNTCIHCCRRKSFHNWFVPEGERRNKLWCSSGNNCKFVAQPNDTSLCSALSRSLALHHAPSCSITLSSTPFCWFQMEHEGAWRSQDSTICGPVGVGIGTCGVMDGMATEVHYLLRSQFHVSNKEHEKTKCNWFHISKQIVNLNVQ